MYTIYIQYITLTDGFKRDKIAYNETRIFWFTYVDKAHDNNNNNKGFRYNYCYTELVPPLFATHVLVYIYTRNPR